MRAMALKTGRAIKNNSHIIISFLVPVIISGAAYAANGIYPSGPRTILISDMEGQYIDFYSSLYSMLKSNGSLFYSFNAGMGHNLTGIYAYYLSSPFSFLILFFKHQDLANGLYLMTLLKIGAAGMAFSIYYKHLYRRLSPFGIAFSAAYALMSYCIVYSFNIMWLDGVIMLPIVLTGLERIINENKFILFTISLIITFTANFYISYMVGIFSFLYFIAGCYSRHMFGIRAFTRKFGLFILSTLLAAGSAAFLLVPAFFALRNGMDVPSVYMPGWGVNFKPAGLIGRLPAGAYTTLTGGLPNIYCGLLMLVLASLYFANTRVGFREKISYLFLTACLVLGFVLYNFNIMWHGFDAPNWFPFRQSFLFSFLLVSLAARCFNALDGVKVKTVLLTSGIWILILAAFLTVKPYYHSLSGMVAEANIIFISIYGILLCWALCAHSKRRLALSALLFLVLIESFFNTLCLMSGMDGEFHYASKEEYDESLTIFTSLVGRVKENDNGFYRLDRTGGVGRSFNDSMNIGYNGIAHFSSMMNGGLNSFLNRLGFITPVTHAVDYSGSTLITDSLLGVKYILSDKHRGFGYREILKEGNISVYENIYALPMGFTADKSLLDLKLESGNPFELQNEIMNLAVGNGDIGYISYLSPLMVKDMKLSNVSYSIVNGVQHYKRIDGSREAFVEFMIDNSKDQQVYGYLPYQDYSLVDIYVNDNFIESYLHFYNNTIFDLGYHHKNDNLVLKLVLREDSFTVLNRFFYGLDGVSIDRAVSKLKHGGFEVSEAMDTYIKGSVKSDKEGLLYTSIPYDPGWNAVIDGEKAIIRKIGGALICIDLPEGSHEVEFSFVPQGLVAGAIISGISLLVFAIIIYFCCIGRGRLQRR